jgi:hypothetical protein
MNSAVNEANKVNNAMTVRAFVFLLKNSPANPRIKEM